MGWYGQLAGAADDAARGTDEWVGQRTDWDGAVENADNPVQGTMRRVTGALNFTAASLPGAVDNPREQWVARGGHRTLVDSLVDYEGTWGGRQDSEDLLGPSIDLRDLGSGDGETALDWRSENSQENDPTSPENSWLIRWLMNNWETAAVGVVGLYLLTLLAPLFQTAANVTEGA
jgi:hypothetical protein